ncbi:excinuclease ABC subunit A [Aliiroseovarius sp. PrR006]|nr:excinuclease ABC subunit A [Aliiroseovarius sp. PrR006]
MAGASFAGNGKGNGVGNGGCPPGLAKKNPPCVPPGLAKPKEGDYVHDYDYRPITDYDRYRLDPEYSYYRVGEMIYRADPTTFQILEIIGLMDELLR